MSTLCHASTYALKDLKSLAEIDEFREYFAHAKDISPHKRDEEWKSLTIKTFQSYLRFLEKFTPVAERDFKSLLALNNWKILREDESQRVRMNVLLKDYLQEQLKKGISPQVLETAKVFWGQNHNDYTIGYSLGKLLLAHDSKNKLGHQMISSGLRSPVADTYCADPEIHGLIIKKLQSTLENLAPADDFDVKMSQYINRKCWGSIKPVLVKTLENPRASSREKTLSLNILNSDYETDNNLKTYTQFLFLVDAPEKSKSLNSSWTTLEELKKNPDLRTTLIQRLEKLDSLPDRTFKQLDDDQSYYLAKNILKNFPEFPNMYAKKCLQFLKGKIPANPTFYCQNFYRVLRSSDYKSISPLAYEVLSPYFQSLKSIR